MCVKLVYSRIKTYYDETFKTVCDFYKESLCIHGNGQREQKYSTIHVKTQNVNLRNWLHIFAIIYAIEFTMLQ